MMNTTAPTSDTRRIDAEKLFKQYWVMVFRRCQSLLNDDESAYDAAQEVFMKVLEHADTLRADYPSSLLWRMATNHCLNVLRNHANRDRAENGESILLRIAQADNPEAQALDRGVLRWLFRQHPESSRTIAVLHLVDGMTLEETAREVGMSVSGVRKRLRALRETLTELEEV
ncbi:MAG: sigma-70 family RNA polymerase sigma factor [Chitinispirillia bacterium]|nr:sigma-70 family RNA polymerase sigma factor [Chitinispirillia bacterium]MCL2242316.1 sigma-70 family RNA polymerase sigma factor [Chitinispirillia bacterium]